MRSPRFRFCFPLPAVLYAQNILVARDNPLVVFASVRKKAVRAVLDAVFFILKRAAAVAAQSVKRAVAEKTIEISRVRALVAGKILAFFMRKIAVILRHIGSF